MVKIRAKVSIGTGIVAGTPAPPTLYDNHILSFNVTKARGQISSFSCQLKVKAGEVTGNILGNSMIIEAGEGSPSNKIFTGIIRSINISPCRDDPLFVIMNLSGNDVLSKLEGKKYTRRCRSSRGMWIEITGVQRAGLKTGKLAYTPQDPTLETMSGDVEKKDNVTNTRTAPLPADKVDKLPQDAQPRKVTFEVRGVEA